MMETKGAIVAGRRITPGGWKHKVQVEIPRRTSFASGVRADLLFFERGALARNEDGAGRLDVELLRVVALVDGNADAVARIDEQQRIADGRIHESFHIRQSHRFLVDFDPEFVAQVVAELLE